jgi:hypothetical protein
MSCLLNTYGKITNLNNIINFLSPPDSNQDDKNETEKISGIFFLKYFNNNN